MGQIIRVWLEEFEIDALVEEHYQRSWLILNYDVAEKGLMHGLTAFFFLTHEDPMRKRCHFEMKTYALMPTPHLTPFYSKKSYQVRREAAAHEKKIF